MKTIKYIVIALLLVTGNLSCKKFLEVKPQDSVPDDLTIVDKTSAQTALRGVYRALSADGYYGSSFPSIGYLQGDNVQWTGSQSIVQQFIDHKVKADNATVAAVWSAIYATINRANYVIAKVPTLEDKSFTDADRNQTTGEAYFIRALCYFDLARTWGGVQLVLTPTYSSSDKTNIKRSAIADTYAQVLADLNKAATLLASPTAQNPVRANKETAWALLARYYLYQQNWAEAAAYASKVIGNATNYQLLIPYGSFFSPSGAVATRESVFELSYSTTYTNGHRGQWQPPANGGTRQIAPSDAFVALVNDPVTGGNRNVLVAKTAAGLWYGNLYYRSPATDPAYVLRIAELYLIRAEANAQQNNLGLALADLNAVRERAGLTSLNLPAQGDVLLAIENENRIEFAFEPHRWFDLVRTRRVGAVLGLSDPAKYILPVPATELLTDPALEQNPGY